MTEAAAGSAPDRFKIIAMVSSVGGLAATSEILGALPARLPAAVLVLQHAEPTRANLLADILAGRSLVPVELAQDGERLRPGRILVAPSGMHTLIAPDLVVRLITSGAAPPSRPSADLLLTTLALAGRARVIAVVLSGSGIDAATGATAVHTFGGFVIASDEASSENFSMPAATIGRAGITDVILPLNRIAAQLVELVAAAEPGAP